MFLFRAAGFFFLASSLYGAAACESLSSLALPDATVTLARTVGAGQFKVPPNGEPQRGPGDFSKEPPFCRVAATLRPSADSEIKIEVWMPVEGWNGKFQAVGNGGWNGWINYQGLGGALLGGYASASTDTGHVGPNDDASFALGHPEKLIDFGYRAVHEMTLKAKAIIAAYYGNGPKYSYWNGCSSGGKQGLEEAQKFPADYDGIVAGAPANYWTHLMFGIVWPATVVHKAEASRIPASKARLLHNAVLEACDVLDGVKDGVLEDPSRCHFDPHTLLCKGKDAADCLTAPQVEAARDIYGGAKNPRTGQEIFPGLMPGAELNWGIVAGEKPYGIPLNYFRYVVFKDPGWDWHKLNFDTDVALADKLDGGLLNATDPDLKPFLARGGRLLLYHGWSDPLIAPGNTVNYYRSVLSVIGSATKAADFVRLFMIPGMRHCGNGDGTSVFDRMSAIEQWVEKGQPPDRIIARRVDADGKTDRTRPLCPYPAVATYTGTGSIDDAANFVCKAPQ